MLHRARTSLSARFSVNSLYLSRLRIFPAGTSPRATR